MSYVILKPDELAHARVYSHKYIRREPDGKGGYKYYYKTDLNVRPVNGSGTITATSYSDGGRRPISKYRQADKASQIYREGQSQNARDYKARQKRNVNKVSTEYPETKITEKTIIPEKYITENYQLKNNDQKKKSVGDYAKQAVSAISTAAGSAYDAGKKWLSSIFK